ncbi:MAG: hypothetical protein Q4G59_05640, partial [Planctomycetia bacterium]|nr:hypothetical protein [Planctomycetia bacterium]
MMKRRDFVASLACLSGSAMLTPLAVYGAELDTLRFETPFDGAVIHARSGFPLLNATTINGKPGLTVAVTGFVPTGTTQVELINTKRPGEKIPVKIEGNRFSAQAVITDVLTTFQARIPSETVTAKPVQSRIIWLKESYPRWRFFVDDCSFFMRDIYQKGYKSLFDCFFLRYMKQLHEKYDVKMTLHMFYSTPEEDFNLSMFPTRYKSEWEENADWLRLGFHANNEFPNHTYLVRTREQLIADFDQIRNEIERFAGEKSYTAVVALHWGSIRKESIKVLADKGVRVLGNGSWQLKSKQYIDLYQAPREASIYLKDNDAWYDFTNGMLFSSGELCCNQPSHSPERCVAI